MKALVVYDSKFGNTERLAQVIAGKLDTGEPVSVLPVAAISERDLEGIDLLAVGGPTQAHGLSPALRAFLDRIPAQMIRDVSTVTFDTRLPWARFLTGSAAAASAKRLTKKGARLLVPPESFVVTAGKGPLAEGELARASTWASNVCTKRTTPNS
ncbi:MAG TPA: flavodoxin domain-containing protein [Chloroflexota bacterium]|nr:flavodoxin domain-containing protein [Chloroflexota bacterium]